MRPTPEPRQPLAHRPRLTRWPRRMLALALPGLLFAAGLTATPARAEPATPAHLTGQAEKLGTDGYAIRGTARTPKPQPLVVLPDPVWPSPGSAHVDLQTGRRQGTASRAGTLPVTLRRGAGQAGARLNRVTVEVLDRAAMPSRWRDGVVTRLSAPAGDTSGAAAVTLDYRSFRYAYGAEWASRLRLWSLPECALTTPEKAGCAAHMLVSRNDESAATVTAEVPVPLGTSTAGSAAQGGSLLALAAAPAGDSGDYAATSLASSSTWTVGGSAGSFTWSYPMRTPAAISGPKPNAEISYSSASVDGRSAATNNQPSWIGEGFDYWPGYIERSYVGCSDDDSGAANNPDSTGDLCWRNFNAVLTLNGSTSELIYEQGKGWHARSEDGAKIEKLIGASNGDDGDAGTDGDKGEYWRVTTTDGTQYYFGRDDLPGQSTATDSTWTVPVYGNHAGDPCHAAAFADSDCAQAWRWNLDYVVDVRGNTMSYWYDKQNNQYAQEATDTKNVSYVRGGTLTHIDYGTWDRGTSDRSVTPLAQMLFDTADRCLNNCTEHGSNWPDVPWDQECKADATSCDDYSPTFWSTKRLTKITTRVWDTTKSPAVWQNVDSYTFDHSFPNPNDGTKAGLWLKSIVHAGLVGTPITMPAVTLEPVAKPNRVLTKTNSTNSWQRLANIFTETGSQIQVTYSLPECTSANLPSSPQANTMRCYPVVGPDPYDPDGPDITEWWHKYRVDQVSQSDTQVGGATQPQVNTYYTYAGTPAWHYADDDGLSKPKRKTWDQWRGYKTVSVQVGDTEKTLTKTTYLRGMNGDRSSPSGGTRTVTVAASVGSETVYDEDQYAGMVREQVVYNGTDDKPVSKTVNVPWRSTATASRTINGDEVTARYVNTATTYQGTALGHNGDRGWRLSSTQNAFDETYGTLTRTRENGDTAKTGDEKCTVYSYNRNTTKNIVIKPRQVTTTALTCGNDPSSTDDVISDVRTFYDGADSTTEPPTRGETTRVDSLKDWTLSAGTAWQTTAQATFDVFGRQHTSADAKNNTITTDYLPAAGIPTARTETNVLGWITTTEVNPYWGTPVKVTDTNNRVTEFAYDGLGRTAQVWDVGWPRATHQNQPSIHYTYVYSPDASSYPYIETEALNAAGGTVASYQIFDGMLRPRQEQKPAIGGGRVVSDTFYDQQGRASLTFGERALAGVPSGTYWHESAGSVPTETQTIYNRANQPTDVIFLGDETEGAANIVEKWRTTTSYEGDRTTVTPPLGGTPSTTVVDALGRTTELRSYTTAAGIDGAYDSTQYFYNSKNQLSSMIGAGGNTWAYRYDVKGRQIENRDPDKGTTTSAYNEFDELTKTIDARGEVLVYTYDTLGRKTAVYDDTISDTTKRAEWVYDKLYSTAIVRGQLTETRRYDSNGNVYKWQARGFSDRYQPSGENYVIPTTETGLGGTYVYARSYSPYDGTPTSVSYPPGGNLTAETTTTVHDQSSGLPTSLETSLPNLDAYVSLQNYTAYGEPKVTQFKLAGGVYTEEAISYEFDTRRIHNISVKPETSTGTVSDRTYQWDAAGNVLSVADTPQVGQADTQCFGYDPQRRLTSAWTPKIGVACAAEPSIANLGGPAPYWLDWKIDSLGNRTKETTHTTAGDTVTDYTYPVPGAQAVRPHAVTATATTLPGQSAATTTPYSYDASGNMTSRPGATATQTLTWDAEGKPATIVEGASTTTNLYDADGNRLIRRDANGTTLFLPGMEIRRQVSGGSATLTGTRYYEFAGKTVASRTTANQSLSWLFSDHQGTQQVAVNAYTQQVAIRRQTPYGTPRGGTSTWPNAKGFVNGDADPIGLTHLGAREYDPVLGRFVSVDPVQDLTDPQQWNGYAYAGNSPITASDPSGLSCIMEDGSQCGPPQRTPPKDDCTKSCGGKPNSNGNGVSDSDNSRNQYCFLNPDAPSCQKSTPKVATIVGGQLIVAPSAAELDAAVNKYFTCGKGGWLEGPPNCANAANSDVIAPEIVNGICHDHPDWCRLQDISQATLVSGAGVLGYGQFGKSGKPPHVAKVTVLDADGNIVLETTLRSGNMTEAEAALGFPRSSLATHTEARAVVLPEIEPGGYLVIEGQYAPCSSCKGAMTRTAVGRNVTIAYQWKGRVWVATPYGSGWRYQRLANAIAKGQREGRP